MKDPRVDLSCESRFFLLLRSVLLTTVTVGMWRQHRGPLLKRREKGRTPSCFVSTFQKPALHSTRLSGPPAHRSDPPTLIGRRNALPLIGRANRDQLHWPFPTSPDVCTTPRASSVTNTKPPVRPTKVGVNVTVTVQSAPTASVAGQLFVPA